MDQIRELGPPNMYEVPDECNCIELSWNVGARTRVPFEAIGRIVHVLPRADRREQVILETGLGPILMHDSRTRLNRKASILAFNTGAAVVDLDWEGQAIRGGCTSHEIRLGLGATPQERTPPPPPPRAWFAEDYVKGKGWTTQQVGEALRALVEPAGLCLSAAEDIGELMISWTVSPKGQVGRVDLSGSSSSDVRDCLSEAFGTWPLETPDGARKLKARYSLGLED
jgi:hypothetical protein